MTYFFSNGIFNKFCICWSNVQNLFPISWSQLGCVLQEKGWLYFIDKKAKVNRPTGYYINALLPKLLEDCHDLMHVMTTSYFSRMADAAMAQ